MSARLTIVGVLAAAIFSAAAPLAHAGNGTVSRSADGKVITVTMGDGVDSLFVTSTGAFPDGSVTIDENSGGATTKLTPAPSSGCVVTGADNDDVSCPRSALVNGSSVAAERLVLALGDGADYTEVGQLASISITLEIHGGAGDDSQLWGSERGDVIDGGPGNDELIGFRGADTLNGGTGDDLLTGAQDADVYDGGDGFDAAFMTNADVATGVAVSLDDVANDGVNQGAEGDNVRSSVEDVSGTSHDDRLVGSAGSNVLMGQGGNDKLDGGGGGDRYDAGDGDDDLMTRDGAPERVVCGAGDDHVTADDVDETTGCEHEDRAALTPPATDGDGDGVARPADCDDRNAAIHPGAAEVSGNGIDDDCQGGDAIDADRDHDGSPRPFDCDDTNPAVRPGGVEVRGNRVDENCDGVAAAFERVASTARVRWARKGAKTRATLLGIANAVAGSAVELRCRGRGCPFTAKRRCVARSQKLLNLLALVRKARFPAGVTLEIRITKPQTTGLATAFAFRGGTLPSSGDADIKPSAGGPRCAA